MLWLVKETSLLTVHLVQPKNIAELVAAMEKARTAVTFLLLAVVVVVAKNRSVDLVKAALSPTTGVVQHLVIAFLSEVTKRLSMLSSIPYVVGRMLLLDQLPIMLVTLARNRRSRQVGATQMQRITSGSLSKDALSSVMSMIVDLLLKTTLLSTELLVPPAEDLTVLQLVVAVVRVLAAQRMT